ncbi:hypothetical protein COCNU_scaffold004134G000020 [Cocos nucifera]|nr:hypothetical protein [Cocos nucifera]
MSEVVDHMADPKPWQLVWGSLRTILKEKIGEVEHLVEEKTVKIESLQGALRKEFISVGLKAALALEEERKKEAEIKVIELEARMAKSISKVMIWTVEEFKASSEMRNPNVKFGQQAFIKGLSSMRAELPKNFPSLT